MRRVRLLTVGAFIIGAATGAYVLLDQPHGEDMFSGVGSIPTDAYYVSPQGSDQDPGSASRPWLTLAKAAAAAGAGDTVVFRAGTYGAVDTTQLIERSGTPSGPITFRGDPTGPMPKIIGHFRINGSNLRFNYLLFDGPTGRIKPPVPANPNGEQVQVAIYGADVEISDSEIRDSLWHAGIYLESGDGVELSRNYIHNNGDFEDPGQANLSHGIYWAKGSGVVANNVIEDNVARGVQLHPEPSDVLIAYNTIVGNGRAGIQFSRETSNSLAVNNIAVSNGDAGIRSYRLTGAGNEARRNLLWGNGSDRGLKLGLLHTDAIAQPPGFSGGYQLERTSPAVNAAIPIAEVGRDRAGHPRPRGEASDLGAYESW